MMSDLRAAVAKAIVGHRCGCSNNGCPWFPDRQVGTNGMCVCTPPHTVADAAIAAMPAHQPEPTPDEIDAAWTAFRTRMNDEPWQSERENGPYAEVIYHAMRAALIAARKVQP